MSTREMLIDEMADTIARLTRRAEAAEQSLADRTAQMTREISDLRAALTEAAGTIGPASYVVQLRDSASLWRERCTAAEAKVDDLRAKLARAEGVVGHMRDLAEHECTYRDGCPTFGSRHGQCTGCKAREALAKWEEG